MDYSQLVTFGRGLQDVCHGAAKSGGWWTHPVTKLQIDGLIKDSLHHPDTLDAFETMLADAIIPQKLLLINSEVIESMEGHRCGKMDDKLPERLMIEVELADAAIRIFDLAGALGLDIGAAIAEKMHYNAQRADHKHENRQKAGGKRY